MFDNYTNLAGLFKNRIELVVVDELIKDSVVHYAAESHKDNSLIARSLFIQTNVMAPS